MHSQIHTYTNTFRIVRVFTWFSFRRYKVWELQSEFSECALRISRIITETTILLYEKGDANLETSHRELGPRVNTNHLERARPWALVASRPTLGYFPHTFAHHSDPSSTVSDDLCTRELELYHNYPLWAHTLTGNICDQHEKRSIPLVSVAQAKIA
jgi:hypothetical protein